MTLPVVTAAYFAGVFPELANTPEAVIDALNPVAALYISETIFPPQAQQYAVGLVIAHFLKQDQLGGGGSLTADRVGAISTSQAALPTDQGQFKTTTYGMRFIELGRLYRLPSMNVGGGGSQAPIPFGGFQPTWSRPWWR